MSPTNTERRSHPRIHLEVPVTFTLDDGDAHPGTSQNLSASGIYMTTDYPVKLGTHLHIQLDIPNKSLHAEGNVVRCKFDKKPDLFHLCVQFSKTHEAWMQDHYFSN